MMRIFAIHDEAGIISEIVTAPADVPAPKLMTAPNLSMTEIDLPKDMNTNVVDSVSGLTELVKDYRVELKPHKSALVRRS